MRLTVCNARTDFEPFSAQASSCSPVKPGTLLYFDREISGVEVKPPCIVYVERSACIFGSKSDSDERRDY
jgi:hypothetical protein